MSCAERHELGRSRRTERARGEVRHIGSRNISAALTKPSIAHTRALIKALYKAYAWTTENDIRIANWTPDFFWNTTRLADAVSLACAYLCERQEIRLRESQGGNTQALSSFPRKSWGRFRKLRMFRDPDEASKKRSRKAGCPSCPRNEASTASVRKRNYRRAVNLSCSIRKLRLEGEGRVFFRQPTHRSSFSIHFSTRSQMLLKHFAKVCK